MPRVYHVQFGLSRQVGRFAAEGLELEPWQSVVVKSSRGMELATVIAPAETQETSDLPEILRIATPADLDRARHLVADRHRMFDEFRRIFDEGVWPIEPIDVEPLLEPDTAVLHYLGPHRLDLAGLRAALRVACGLDLVFEPAGRDVPLPEPDPEPEPEDSGCGSCGSDGGCGSSKCGTSSDSGSKGSGCSGCSVKGLVAKRKAAATLA